MYDAIKTEASFCPDCGAAVTLLSSTDVMGPAFYICTCGFIGQVGFGVIRHGDKKETAEES